MFTRKRCIGVVFSFIQTLSIYLKHFCTFPELMCHVINNLNITFPSRIMQLYYLTIFLNELRLAICFWLSLFVYIANKLSW